MIFYISDNKVKNASHWLLIIGYCKTLITDEKITDEQVTIKQI